MKEESGLEFINEKYREMHIKESVKKSSKEEDSKIEKINKYLKRLEKIHENKPELIKKYYHKKYIIKKEAITDKYFKHLEQIALDRGCGHVRYTEEMKEEVKERIIKDQTKSLDTWIDYMSSEDTKMYPIWFKYYAFQSMVKLGSYNKETNTYNQRTEYTTATFAELNREALSLTYNYINNNINKTLEIKDKELEKLIKTESFKKIYTYIIKKIENKIKSTPKGKEGEWKKYNQGTDHMKLVKDIEGKGTGWCSAGEEVAKEQLKLGDFYVYYSYDEKGQATIPRIAIRMEGNKIGEIRGVAKNQNMEPEMEEVLNKKLEEFPDKEEYKKKVKDMEKLTKIYKEYKNRELEITELRFLYEIDNKINGFGYQKDPRIEEILNKRDIKKDLSKIFNCREEQIAIKKEEALKGNIIYYRGNLNLDSLTTAEGLTLPQHIGGFLNLEKLTTAEDLILPQHIGGSLNLEKLTTAEDLILPQHIGEFLYLGSLTKAEGLTFPQHIGGFLYLGSLTTAEDLILPQHIGGFLCLGSLTTAEDLILPQHIGGDLDLRSLTTVGNLTLPQHIGGFLCLGSLTTAEDLILPQHIGGDLDLRSLTTVGNLTLPQHIGGSLFLNSLTTVEDLTFPDKFNINKLYCDQELKEQLLNRNKII